MTDAGPHVLMSGPRAAEGVHEIASLDGGESNDEAAAGAGAGKSLRAT